MSQVFQVTPKVLLGISPIQTKSLWCIYGRYLHPFNYAQRARRPIHTTISKPSNKMHVRRISAAILLGVVSYRAWHSYNKHPGHLEGGTVIVDSNFRSKFEKRAVEVGAETLNTGNINSDGPIYKQTDKSGRKVLEMISPEQATKKLRQNEESYLIKRGRGAVRFDTVQIPSNVLIEDDHAEKIIEMSYPKAGTAATAKLFSDWMFWGVYDGHSGWTTSDKLRQVLINYVVGELNSTYEAGKTNMTIEAPSIEAIHTAIKTGFTRLDDEIVNQSVEKTLKANSKLAAAELLAPAMSGSCALLTFYDSRSEMLHVACTGDSRAVLGRRGSSEKWTAVPLSVDQTGSNPDEEARIRKEHPGEDNVILNGRVLGGLEPTRAFGDAMYKWTRPLSEMIKTSYFGRTPSKYLATPPYVTAEPVVTSTKIYPEKNDFVVIATDGLWEMLSNEEVVGLVGKWIEKQKNNPENTTPWMKFFRNNEHSNLPVEQNGKKSKNSDNNGQKTPIRQKQWGIKGEDERFVVDDKNVATHLVRNALGGRDSEMLCALLSLPAPYSRRYRDDLTVKVIFFGEGDTSGEVELNKEASANTRMLKALL